MPRKLIVLCRSRVGSYFLLDLFRNFKETVVELEIFNQSYTSISPGMEYVRQYLKNKYQLPKNFGHVYYEETYQKLNEYHEQKHPNKLLVFKVIYHQIPLEFLNNIINDLDTIVIILDRNRIDCLTSYIKASSIKKWNLVDTTNLKVKLNDQQLLTLIKEYENKFANEHKIQKMINSPHFLLQYEDLIESNKLRGRLKYLTNIINKKLNINLTVIDKPHVKYFKQDHGDNSELKNRISKLMKIF